MFPFASTRRRWALFLAAYDSVSCSRVSIVSHSELTLTKACRRLIITSRRSNWNNHMILSEQHNGNWGDRAIVIVSPVRKDETLFYHVLFIIHHIPHLYQYSSLIQKIIYGVMDRSSMHNGPWLMAQGILGAWPGHLGARGGRMRRGGASWRPGRAPHEPWTMGHEAININRRWINSFVDPLSLYR